VNDSTSFLSFPPEFKFKFQDYSFLSPNESLYGSVTSAQMEGTYTPSSQSVDSNSIEKPSEEIFKPLLGIGLGIMASTAVLFYLLKGYCVKTIRESASSMFISTPAAQGDDRLPTHSPLPISGTGAMSSSLHDDTTQYTPLEEDPRAFPLKRYDLAPARSYELPFRPLPKVPTEPTPPIIVDEFLYPLGSHSLSQPPPISAAPKVSEYLKKKNYHYLTICIPCYNEQDYELTNAIESILKMFEYIKVYVSLVVFSFSFLIVVSVSVCYCFSFCVLFIDSPES
jgi:hypothetical protein